MSIPNTKKPQETTLKVSKNEGKEFESFELVDT